MAVKPFLQIVAEDLYRKFGNKLYDVAVVFPNNRAKLFMNQYLGRLSQPLWSPSYISISDLFERQTPLRVADDLQLVSLLYRSYQNVMQDRAVESLDDFFGWGQLLLSDFDDVDKHMAPAGKVFGEMENYHELDAMPELSEEQKAALEAFFNEDFHNRDTLLEQRFREFWQKLYPIYTDFRERLLAEGLAYEGMLQRQVVEQKRIKLRFKTYVFVGFNMLQEVERQLFKLIKDERETLFYWDFDEYYMHQGSGDEAGRFVSQNLKEFGNALPREDESIYNNLRQPKQISFVSAQTNSIQAHYVSTWLSNQDRASGGERTAIVMCDETLLPTIVHALPAGIGNVNITTGFPLIQTPAYSFVQALIALQAEGNPGHGDVYRISQVREVLGHPFATRISLKADPLLKDLLKQKATRPTRTELALDEGLTALFSPVFDDTATDATLQLLDYLRRMVALAGSPVQETEAEDFDEPQQDPLTEESIFRMYTLLNRLYNLCAKGDLPVNESTLRRLFTSIAQTTTIPYDGEPVSGLQVMGVLETRNLDFDHLLVLSCNEGNMPKGISDTSFIPYSVRKAYGLTTADNKVAIFAFYFYRLLQRAQDVTLCYSNSTQGTSANEMSRFMRQLMVESNQKIALRNIATGTPGSRQRVEEVEKRREYLDRILQKDFLSPTAINNYLRCQLLFFYKQVMGVQEPDNRDDEQMDQRDFGNIFHKACENLYSDLKGQLITADIVRQLKAEANVSRVVEEAFQSEYLHFKSPRRINYTGSQLIIIDVVKHYIRRLLEKDERLAPFRILALEQKVLNEYEIDVDGTPQMLKIGGMIDRLDCIHNDSEIRVVDYKTGGKPKGSPKGIGDIFDPDTTLNVHGDYYLQALLYSLNIGRSEAYNPAHLPVSPALLYIRQASADDYDPVLSFGKVRISDAETYRPDYEAKLKALLRELFDSRKPFKATTKADTCSKCAFRQLCGR